MMSAQSTLVRLVAFLALCFFSHLAQARNTSDENSIYQDERRQYVQGSYISMDEAKEATNINLTVEPNKAKHHTLMPRRSKQFSHSRALPMQISENKIISVETLSSDAQNTPEDDNLDDEEDLEQIAAEEIIFNNPNNDLHSDYLPISLNN